MTLFQTEPPQSILGWRDGETFEPIRDLKPLNGQALDVWMFMNDGRWHTNHEISQATGYPEGSITARYRDFRKPKFGGHAVHRRPFMGRTFEYLLEVKK